MAHKEQQDFVKILKSRNPEWFKEVRVLDIGSLDVNGNNRVYFQDSEYIGLDIGKGANVDVVSIAHEYKPEEPFDVVISTEALEHDFFFEKTLKAAVEFLKPGGVLILTAATTGREEHGTKEKHSFTSPLTVKNKKFKNHYKNVTIQMIEDAIEVEKTFENYEYQINNNCYDIYFYGVKRI